MCSGHLKQEVRDEAPTLSSKIQAAGKFFDRASCADPIEGDDLDGKFEEMAYLNWCQMKHRFPP
jgi:hypothetical protein